MKGYNISEENNTNQNNLSGSPKNNLNSIDTNKIKLLNQYKDLKSIKFENFNCLVIDSNGEE